MTELYHPANLHLSDVLYALADPSRLNLVRELTQETEIASTGFRSIKADVHRPTNEIPRPHMGFRGFSICGTANTM